MNKYRDHFVADTVDCPPGMHSLPYCLFSQLRLNISDTQLSSPIGNQLYGWLHKKFLENVSLIDRRREASEENLNFPFCFWTFVMWEYDASNYCSHTAGLMALTDTWGWWKIHIENTIFLSVTVELPNKPATSGFLVTWEKYIPNFSHLNISTSDTKFLTIDVKHMLFHLSVLCSSSVAHLCWQPFKKKKNSSKNTEVLLWRGLKQLSK